MITVFPNYNKPKGFSSIKFIEPFQNINKKNKRELVERDLLGKVIGMMRNNKHELNPFEKYLFHGIKMNKVDSFYAKVAGVSINAGYISGGSTNLDHDEFEKQFEDMDFDPEKIQKELREVKSSSVDNDPKAQSEKKINPIDDFETFEKFGKEFFLEDFYGDEDEKDFADMLGHVVKNINELENMSDVPKETKEEEESEWNSDSRVESEWNSDSRETKEAEKRSRRSR